MARVLSYNPLLKSYPDSEKINAVSEGAEVLYARLIAQSDDYGRYYGEPRFVLAKLFTARMITGEVKEDEVGRRLQELFWIDLIRFYEVAGIRYLQMVDVHKRLRNDVARDARFPPPGTDPERCEGQPPPGHVSLSSRSRPAYVTDTSRVRHACDEPTQPNPTPITNPNPLTASAVMPDTLAVKDALLTFPCEGVQPEWHLTPPVFQDFKELYPTVDVMAECRKALAWVKAKPDRKKTARGMRAFLTNWLNTHTDRRTGYGNRGTVESGARAGYDPSRKDGGDI